MPSLLSDSIKTQAESLRSDIFDTFARPIVVSTTPTKVIISTDENYNFAYENPDGVGQEDYVEYTPKSATIQACIQYDKSLDRLFANKFGSANEDIRITTNDGYVRVKISKADYDEYIGDAINFQFDGWDFERDRTPRPHGMFAPKFYTLFLKFKN
jgi:hypothetical protein